MVSKLYGIPVRDREWRYKGFKIEETSDLVLRVKDQSGAVIESISQEFTYNLTAYRIGALNSVLKKIDLYIQNK